MKSKWSALVALVVGVLGVVAVSCGGSSGSGTASVTASPVASTSPPPAVNAAPLAPVGHFDAINASAKNGDWSGTIQTKGVSDVYVTEVTIQPGAALGWHMHLGPSFVIVKSGTATFYEANDPACTPHVIPTGSSLFEPAADVHIVRNEGSVPLVNVVFQLLPTGTPRLISKPKPGNCSF